MKKAMYLSLMFFVGLSVFGQSGLDHFEPRYSLMNGFDFGLDNIDKLKYVGHFNIYIPVANTTGSAAVAAAPGIPAIPAVPARNKRWGINTGLFKLNNLTNDTITRFSEDKVLNNPLDELNVGSSYKEQYNKYTNVTSISTYSAYFQVLRRIFANNDMALSCHLHSELLLSKIRSSVTIDSITSKQVIIASDSDIPKDDQIMKQILPTSTNNYTTAVGYFGGGVTYDYCFANRFSLFAQLTIGTTLEHPNKNSPRNGLGYDGYDKAFFYLTRCYFQCKTSNDPTSNTQIIVGVDFRGIVQQVPLNSIYVGLNIDLDKITALFN